MTWATRNVGAARVGIAVMVLFLYGMSLVALAMIPIPVENKEAFAVGFGGLNAALGMVAQHYFGARSRPTT